MDVILRPTPKKAVSLVVRLIEETLKEKPAACLGLATGRTMEAVYAALVERSRKGAVDLSSCRFFALDEYIGLGPSDERSYHHYLHHHLFDPLGVSPENITLLNGLSGDHAGAAREYERAISNAGGIDLQLLGLGKNGHMGFNEPGSSLRSRTRDVILAEETLAQNAAMFGGDPQDVPPMAITMGVETILESKRCLMLVTGTSKQPALAATVEGPVTEMVTASALQLHPDCIVIADEAAGGKLDRMEDFRSKALRDPTWAARIENENQPR